MAGPLSLGTVSTAPVPPEIAKGGPAARKAYETALGFEQLLVRQLTQQIVSASGLDGSADDGSSGDGSADDSGLGSSPYASMLPDALAQSITDAGGLGLAAQMAPLLEGKQR